MGIWAAWVPVGMTAMMLIAPALARSAGWRAVWWFGAAYALVTTVVYLAAVNKPPAAAGDRDHVFQAKALTLATFVTTATASETKKASVTAVKMAVIMVRSVGWTGPL